MMKNRLSILFTIGYFHSRAMWYTINEITRSSEDLNYLDNLIKSIETEEKQWFPQQCINKIEELSISIGLPWNDYITELNYLVGVKELANFLLELKRNDSPLIKKSEILNNMINELSNQSGIIINNAGKYLLEDLEKSPNGQSEDQIEHSEYNKIKFAELEMVFIGHQIGKIDQLVLIAEAAQRTEGVLPPCRNFLEILFNHVERNNIQQILSEFPGIEARVKDIGYQELKSFIAKMKENYLYKIQ